MTQVNGIAPSPVTPSTAPLPPAAARAAQAAQIIGFRIMRRTEIAPGWWGQPTEVGDTPSSIVADTFCAKQNKVTMDLNRSKRIEFYADPIYAAMSPADHAAHTAASYTRPNPAAATLYTQAATDYETAARDADKLGAHDRADNHRHRAAEHRALADAHSGDSDPNPDEALRRARTTRPLPRQAVGV